MADWFTTPHPWPPLHVTLLHAAQFTFLAGLLLGWRWELVGGVLARGAAVLYFPLVRGKNAIVFLQLVWLLPSFGSAIGIIVLLLGTATGNAYLMLAMAVAAIVGAAIFTRKSFSWRALFGMTVAAAMAFAVAFGITRY